MPAPAERRIIFRHIDEPGYSRDLACYQRNGGYSTEIGRASCRERVYSNV